MKLTTNEVFGVWVCKVLEERMRGIGVRFRRAGNEGNKSSGREGRKEH